MSHTTTDCTTSDATSPTTVHLVHRPGRIFETLGFDEHSPLGGIKGGRHSPLGGIKGGRHSPLGGIKGGKHWAAGGYDEGRSVRDDSAPMQALLAELHFVLPRLTKETAGKFPILSVARDRPTDRRPEGAKPDCVTPEVEVYLHFSYEPCEERFLVGANAGTESPDLQVCALDGATVAKYTGRVLRAFVLITPDGIFPSLEDPFTHQQELFAQLPLSDLSSDPPWGKSPAGTWRIRSGAGDEHEEDQASFPAGFGLSDLRVTVFAQAGEDFVSLPYSGTLDHLMSAGWDDDDVNPFGPDDDWDFGDDAPMSQALFDLADQLFTLTGGVSTWARRARGLAEETEQLARRVPEEPFDSEGGEDEGM